MFIAGYSLVFGLCIHIVTGNSFRHHLLQPEPLESEIWCSSHSRLCHMAYNISTDGTGYNVIHGDEPICRCRGNQQCEISWNQDRNSIIKRLKNGGQEMQVKMSYCHLNHPARVCRQNEVAVRLRGRGVFSFEIDEDFRCRCYRDLYAHRSWRAGDIDFTEYSCGKPRCGGNRHPSTQCTKITYDGSEENLRHEYLCRCPRNQDCVSGDLPTRTNRVVMRHCLPTINRLGIYGPNNF